MSQYYHSVGQGHALPALLTICVTQTYNSNERMTQEARSTKDRILSAAETLLAQRGPGETSLRDITAAAGVNLAAVNYHFQSKDALFRAVVEARVVPMNARRLELLDAAEKKAGKRGPTIARVLEAFLLPPLELLVTAPQFVPLMGRIYSEPQFVEEIVRRHMLPMKTVTALKGPARPVVGERERSRVLAALAAVDAVVVFGEPTPLEAILALRPDIIVKGGDYKPETVVGAKEVQSWGGQVRIVPIVGGVSTTNLIASAADR